MPHRNTSTPIHPALFCRVVGWRRCSDRFSSICSPRWPNCLSSEGCDHGGSCALLSTKSDRQIVGIDLVRFGAACGVMLYHLCYLIIPGGPYAPTRLFPEFAFFRFGNIGIFVFFVISGFVIAYSAH